MRKLYKSYKKLLDKKISNTTFIVAIISMLIILVGVYVPNTDLKLASKNNVLEIKNKLNTTDIVHINGKKYKLILEEIE